MELRKWICQVFLVNVLLLEFKTRGKIHNTMLGTKLTNFCKGLECYQKDGREHCIHA